MLEAREVVGAVAQLAEHVGLVVDDLADLARRVPVLLAQLVAQSAQTITLVVSLPLVFTFWLSGISLLKSLQEDYGDQSKT